MSFMFKLRTSHIKEVFHGGAFKKCKFFPFFKNLLLNTYGLECWATVLRFILRGKKNINTNLKNTDFMQMRPKVKCSGFSGNVDALRLLDR